MKMQEKIHEIKPLTIEDMLNVPPLPPTHDIRVDLYWCARGKCCNCSQKRTRSKIDVGDCRHDLLDIANELLAILERTEK